MKELENASARFHISRLEAIELSIRNEFEKAYKIQDDKIRQNVLETYDDRYYRTCYEVQSKFGIGFDVSGVDTDKVKKLITKPWASDNKTFSDRVWTKKNEMIDTLRSQLIRTCATGGNIQDAVNSMMSFVSKDVKNARYAATRLLQTETAFFSSVSEKKALKDLDVEQYEILATLDSKTSPICQEMDGQVFKLSEYEIGATAPPFHVNCRSTTCPHFDDEYGERVARDRAGNTYMVPSDMTYKEWREKQNKLLTKDNNKNDDIVIPKGYDIHKHSKEIECANLIQKEIGGNVTMINEDNNKMTADMLWNDKLWELKGVTSKTSIDNAVRHGLKQIAENPGGIILNIDKCKLNDSDIVKYIEDRLNRSKINLKELNVILVRDKSIYKQLEIIKKEIATSTKTGASSISLQQNNTIKNDKSQLKNDDKDEIAKALEYYVSGDGMYINRHLAGLFEKDGGVWTKEDEKILSLLRKGMNNNLKEDVLYRSVDASAVLGNITDTDFENLMEMLIYGEKAISKNDVNKLRNKLNVIGKEIKEPRFMSTTKDKDIALNWGDFTGSDKSIVLELKLNKIIKGADLAKFDIKENAQKEVLLEDGLTYRINGFEVVDGQLVFKAEIISKNLTNKSLKNDDKNGIIKQMYSGAISGALDRNSKEAIEHAERYYESIRKRKDEDYLNIIAKRSKIDIDDIRVIKNYIFVDKHELSDGYRRFDSDYEMAESWQRLSDENMELKPQDIIMLNHELLEKQLVDKGYTQEEAHNEANKKFNYEEFFDK